MLNIAVFLLIAGGVLLLIEAFMPGFGVFGLSGILAMIASMVIMVLFVKHGVFIVTGEILLIGLGFYFFIRLIKKNRLMDKLVLTESLNDDASGLVDLASYAGKTGIAATSLRPVGTVNFNGTVLEAYSEGVFITAGQPVIVTDTLNRKIVVRPLEDDVRSEPHGRNN